MIRPTRALLAQHSRSERTRPALGARPARTPAALRAHPCHAVPSMPTLPDSTRQGKAHHKELSSIAEAYCLPQQSFDQAHPTRITSVGFSSVLLGGKFAPMLWTRRSDSPRSGRTDICGPTGLSPGSDSEDGECEISVARIVPIRGVRAEWSTKGQSAIILRRSFLK